MKDSKLSYSNVLDGSALIKVGSEVSLRLVSDRRCLIKVNKEEEIVLVPTPDFVDLQTIDEEKALKICALLGMSDEDMLSLLKRRG